MNVQSQGRRAAHYLQGQTKHAIAMACGTVSANHNYAAFSDYMDWLLQSLDVGSAIPFDEYELVELAPEDVAIFKKEVLGRVHDRYQEAVRSYLNELDAVHLQLLTEVNA